ncbi:hypothetical protein MHBO_000157 [Bonamia ostreae]|uniref:UTP-monosaccharide-1-phosphate uridylyltransferase n=1 Tax=Bonamia ostreae TaxID=126728 RepID=A0ABV2AEN2_9EUKA
MVEKIKSLIDYQNLNDTERKMIKVLEKSAQTHLFEGWKNGEDELLKKQFLEQCAHLNNVHDGGLEGYYNKCRELLSKSAKGENLLRGWVPSVPKSHMVEFASEKFSRLEKMGLEVLGKTAFVLVAGGLGERLGYSGIKLNLCCNLLNEDSFFAMYAKYILAYQKHAREKNDPSLTLPLAIMTSDDTHSKTIEMLNKNNYFGLSRDQVTLLKQEKVPAVTNLKAEFSRRSKYRIETKPHGHGDVHSLLYKSVLRKWQRSGIENVLFFQDTNILVFKALPCLAGNSLEQSIDVNFMVLPRKPGEAVGSICRLKKADGKTMTCNVEYNEFESLLQKTGVKDHKNKNGFSSFPGNANVFILKMDKYLETLAKTDGKMPEYINPKYANKEKSIFKSAARIECAMSDYSMLLESDDNVGCTLFERWMSFSAAKNNMADAIAKKRLVNFSESAASAEADLYLANRRYLRQCGCDIEVTAGTKIFNGLESSDGAMVLLEPSFGCIFEEIKKRFESPQKVSVTKRSSLLLCGNVQIRKLVLDGSLSIASRKTGDGIDNAVIEDLSVSNEGYVFEEARDCDPEEIILRGYKLSKKANCDMLVDEGRTYKNTNKLFVTIDNRF